jgi:hypothetical protein
MITFNVVKEPHGWAIRMDHRMTTPFRSRDMAVAAANSLADAIRHHGECTEVIVEGVDASTPSGQIQDPNRSRPHAPARRTGPE